MPIEAALFFDNDLEYCNTFSPWANRVTPFHIGGYQRPEGEPFPIKPWAEMADFRSRLTQEGKLVFDQLRIITGTFPPEEEVIHMMTLQELHFRKPKLYCVP